MKTAVTRHRPSTLFRQVFPPEAGSSARCILILGQLLFRARQPRKACVQSTNGFGGRFGAECRTGSRDKGNCLRSRPAEALVAAVGPAAPGTQSARLLKGFIEKYLGVFGHGVSRHHTFMASMSSHSQVMKR